MLRRAAATFAVLLVAVGGTCMVPLTATAAGTKCVALVVDFTQTGGSVSSACVTAPTSASGADILVDGHHKVTFDPRYGNDFVCAIDGVPAGGCHATDGTHYWVYYHRPSGSTSWQVSQEGAGTYKPANTSTEGWVYDNGASTAPAPRNVPYRDICAKQPSSSPSSSHSSSPASPSASSLASSPASSSGTRARSTATRSARSAAAVATTPTAQLTVTPTPPPSEPTGQPTARARVFAAAHVSGTQVPWAFLVAAAAAVALGAAAVVRLRRSRT